MDLYLTLSAILFSFVGGALFADVLSGYDHVLNFTLPLLLCLLGGWGFWLLIFTR